MLLWLWSVSSQETYTYYYEMEKTNIYHRYGDRHCAFVRCSEPKILQNHLVREQLKLIIIESKR